MKTNFATFLRPGTLGPKKIPSNPTPVALDARLERGHCPAGM